MDRFSKDGSDEDGIVGALHGVGLPSFEEIREEFLSKAGQARHDITTIHDLIIGRDYTGPEIAIVARIYNHQPGIHRVTKNNGELEAVFVKATLEGGKYPNKWIIPNQVIQYFLYANKDNFDPRHTFNQAVIHSGDRPIFLFVRNKSEGPYRLDGKYRYISLHDEPDGSKWFRLEKRELSEARIAESSLLTEEEVRRDLERRVRASETDSYESRQTRLATSPKLPKRVITQSYQFVRNQDVIVAVRLRAKGVCELCKAAAPFRTRDGRPYLEVHHIVPLADGGEDTVENAVAICPNCHRRAHFGSEPVNWPSPSGS